MLSAKAALCFHLFLDIWIPRSNSKHEFFFVYYFKFIKTMCLLSHQSHITITNTIIAMCAAGTIIIISTNAIITNPLSALASSTVTTKNATIITTLNTDVIKTCKPTMRALAFHQCGPGSISSLGVKCGLSLLVLYSAMRVFSPGSPLTKNQHLI